MTVYFAQTNMSSEAVKIGYTSNISARRSQLSVGVPGGVKIIAELAGGPDVEQYLHEKFSEFRIGGEWFLFTQEIKDFVSKVSSGVAINIPARDFEYTSYRTANQFAEDARKMASHYVRRMVELLSRGHGDQMNALNKVSRLTGLNPRTLRRIMNSEIKDPTISVFAAIRFSYIELFEGEISKLSAELCVEKRRYGNMPNENLDDRIHALSQELQAAKERARQ